MRGFDPLVITRSMDLRAARPFRHEPRRVVNTRGPSMINYFYPPGVSRTIRTIGRYKNETGHGNRKRTGEENKHEASWSLSRLIGLIARAHRACGDREFDASAILFACSIAGSRRTLNSLLIIGTTDAENSIGARDE